MKTILAIRTGFVFSLFLLSSNSFAAEGMPQFNANSFNSQLFWLVVTFSSFYVITAYFILPRIRENIRLRKNKIENDLERAEKIKVEIESMIAQSNLKIEETKNHVQKLITDALIRSNKEYENQIGTLKKQIANKQLETEKNIVEYKKNIEKDIVKSSILLSSTILKKLNYKSSTSKDIGGELLKLSMSDNV